MNVFIGSLVFWKFFFEVFKCCRIVGYILMVFIVKGINL